MNTVFVALVASSAATFAAAALTPVARSLALAVGAVDEPGERRVHERTVPRMGGVAIVLAFALAMFLCFEASLVGVEGAKGRAELIGYGLGGLAIVLGGIFDDVRGLGAKRKLLVQILAASISWYGGARILGVLDLPFLGSTDFGLAFSYLATVAWILALTNAINLIDGLDGLAGGVVFFAALTNVVVALITHNDLAAAVNGALAGATLGFLFYNFNPAKIFMGDTGSLFLGYALSAGALLSGRQKESTLASLLVPLVALGVPLTDTLLAMARRMLARRSIFAADGQHLHHRLLAVGLTHRRAVLLLYSTSVALCVVAIAVAFGKNWEVGAALLGAFIIILGVVRFAGYFELLLQQRAVRPELYTPATQAVRRALPQLVARLASAQNRPSILAALEASLDPEHFPAASLTAAGEALPFWSWDARHTGRREQVLRECSFEVRVFPGTPPAILRFACALPVGDLPPQLEILLRLVADVLQENLVRVHAERPEELVRVVPAE
ncbi:MAG TPA: MraY family glycosyltransferase [Polyangiaceae bacterium]|nr:MraY family glycosyltransferase [Polyangiaceae bacterium]